MNEADLDLKLLGGCPIEINGVSKLYPLILKEIMEIGELKYNQYIFAATFKQDDLEILGQKLNSFQSVLAYCYQQEDFRTLYLESLSKFFKEKVHFHEDGFFYLSDLTQGRIIDENKFDEIVLVIKKQNFIEDKEEEKEFNPHDEAAQAFIEKIKQFRQKVKEKNKEDGLSLSDIISIVSAYSSNLNIFSVWDLTVYQLYTLYIRLMMKENYDSQYYLLPHVSDSKSLDLKHWATKIQK